MHQPKNLPVFHIVIYSFIWLLMVFFHGVSWFMGLSMVFQQVLNHTQMWRSLRPPMVNGLPAIVRESWTHLWIGGAKLGVGCWVVGCYVYCTLPETNIAPTNGWLEYYFPIGETYFQGLR